MQNYIVAPGDIIAPAVVLVLWTLFLLVWMTGKRMNAPGEKVDMSTIPAGIRGSDMEATLPKRTVWMAHNHTHLHEQPTLFYAIVAYAAIIGAVAQVDVLLAWIYVGVRIAHSLWQAFVNTISIRFLLFLIATFCLVALAVRVLMVVCG